VLEGETSAFRGLRMLGDHFSVEMDSKKHVRNISISNQTHDRVFFEGDLGGLLEASIVEGSALEMVGEHGILRFELDENVLRRVLESPDRELRLGSEVGSLTSTKQIGNEKK
jgi:hypothetical protein